jgi:bile acid:Na+ symporter, BASS family
MLIDIILPISLVFIMFSLGLSLTLNDFRNITKQPKAFTVGIINQMLILPLCAFAVIMIFGLKSELAVGLMILSCCPGGVTSNIITKFAKGDTALSISFTAVVSIATVLTLPLITGFSMHYFMKADAPSINILSLGLTMFLLTVIPVSLGLFTHHKAEKFTLRFEPIAGKISTALFALLLLGALAGNWKVFTENVAIMGPAIVTLILLMLIWGYSSSRILKIGESQAVTVGISTGIQNATMGITISNLVLPDVNGLSAISLPSGAYGVIMYIVCLPVIFLYVKLLRQQFISA